MSKLYSVPPDMGEKEKIIGGVFNMVQFFWIVGGVAVGAMVFGIGYVTIGGVPALVLGFLFCLTGLPFALYKKNGLPLATYIIYRVKFKKKVQKLPNMRKEMKF